MRVLMICAVASAGLSPPPLKLSYFDARGAAETTRVLLEFAGVDFDDERWEILFESNAMKTPGFITAKAAGELDSNLGRAPILTVGDVALGQSKAIERYVASTCGLLGPDALTAALVDCLCEHVRDVEAARLMKGFGPFARGTDAEKADARDDWYSTDLPAWLFKIERVVAAGGFSVAAAGRSYADFALWALLRDSTRSGDDAELLPAALEAVPKIRAVVESVEAEPRVAAWVQRRPTTRF